MKIPLTPKDSLNITIAYKSKIPKATTYIRPSIKKVFKNLEITPITIPI